MLSGVSSLLLAFLGPIGTTELIVIGVIGLLIFGRRLPEVGRSLGKGIVEFKKGLKGIDSEIEDASGDRDDAKRRVERDREPDQLPGDSGDASQKQG